jgi:hypothetical protein
VAEAIRKLVRAFEDAKKTLSADALEKARAELLKLLANYAAADKLPLLQRFLRSDMVQLIAALKTPGITASAAQPIVEAAAKALENVRKEAESELSSFLGKFWGASI